MHVSEAARLLDGQHLGGDPEFRGAGTDSRSLEAGALFVALRGPNFDGHDYVAAAKARGAAAALLEREPAAGLPAVLVDDTRRGLAHLAARWRERFDLPLVGVTGSNGKTTVKEMLAAVFATRGPVLATRGNLNNDIGVPLTLLRLGPEHRHAVIEMGANHPGEIADLAGLARPAVAVITLCAPAHLEGFGSEAGVARAKGELIEHLPADGTAIINADDAYAPLWRELAGARRRLHFGLGPGADVTARWEAREGGSRLVLRTPAGEVEADLALPGEHNVRNALAATAAALAVGLDLEHIAAGLAAVRPLAGRLQLRPGRGGARVLDDTYNANPSSLRAGLAVLAGLAGRRWLVLGDMGELGEGAADFHREAGEAARAAGVERLYATGPLSRATVQRFGAGARHFEDRDTLIAALLPELDPEVAVLVKGSRTMHMERVVAALEEGDAACS